MLRTCEYCGVEFSRKPSQRGRFCSQICAKVAPAVDRRIAQEPPPIDGCRWIALTQGEFALVDAVDYERVAKYTWYLSDGRARATVNGRLIKMHQLVFGPVVAGNVPDHINQHPLDNRRTNLREVTRSGNAMNRGLPRNNTSGYKGVQKSRTRWRAQLCAGGMKRHLGVFGTAEAAARAYDAAAYEYFGDVAVLNFPVEPAVGGR